MVETLLFVLVLYFSLWGYFIALRVMDFKKDPNSMEDHLPGRPARRTIGRKNDDVSKGLGVILVGYFLVSIALYGLLDYKDLIPVFMIQVAAFAGLGLSMFLFSYANRLLHAYVTLGQIAVVHVVCATAAFMCVAMILYRYTVSLSEFLTLAMMCVGAMLSFFSRGKPKKINKKEEEF